MRWPTEQRGSILMCARSIRTPVITSANFYFRLPAYAIHVGATDRASGIVSDISIQDRIHCWSLSRQQARSAAQRTQNRSPYLNSGSLCQSVWLLSADFRHKTAGIGVARVLSCCSSAINGAEFRWRCNRDLSGRFTDKAYGAKLCRATPPLQRPKDCGSQACHKTRELNVGNIACSQRI